MLQNKRARWVYLCLLCLVLPWKMEEFAREKGREVRETAHNWTKSQEEKRERLGGGGGGGRWIVCDWAILENLMTKKR